MRRWKFHTIVIGIAIVAFQVAFVLLGIELLYQLIILDTSTSIISVVYAVFAYREYEFKTETVLGSKLVVSMNRLYSAMPADKQEALERNLEQLMAFGMAYADRIAKMTPEEFGERVSFFFASRAGVRIPPQDVQAKVQLVGGA